MKRLAVALAALAALLTVYYFADPIAARWMPRCAFYTITGYQCPGCGFQRALHAALHGHIADAWAYNPFVFFAIPVATLYVIVEARRTRWPALHARLNHPLAITTILAAILTFWLARNIL